jgi:potassium-transporting ATPase KdpC subunit
MKQLRPALLILLVFTVVTGVLYPLLITGLAQLIFPRQATGSLLIRNGQIIGSELIGQQFDQPQYFWSRLSSTSGTPYNASASGGSNFSVLNATLQEQVKARLAALRQADPENIHPVPVDLVTASASGLDPNISLAAAEYQAGRVAQARGLRRDQVITLIQKNKNNRMLGFLGEETVNVLVLNLALDKIQ